MQIRARTLLTSFMNMMVELFNLITLLLSWSNADASDSSVTLKNRNFIKWQTYNGHTKSYSSIYWSPKKFTWTSPSVSFLGSKTNKNPGTLKTEPEPNDTQDLPVYARHIYDDINHVAAELVALHIDRRRVSGDVDLWEYIEEERFFGVGVRDEDVEKVFERWQLRNQLLHDFGESLEDGVVINGRL